MRFFKCRQILSGLFTAVWLLLLMLKAGAGGAKLARYEYTEYHMGVDVRIVAYASDTPTAERACAAAFERFAQLDTIMSDYRADSELMRLCDRAGGPPVPASKDLFRVLERAQQVAQRSGGAFDVTCGPLVSLWRKARKTHVLPAPAEIEQARALVGWQKMQLDARKRTVRLLVPGMKLDLGGIGKGYADDCAQQVLKKYGVTRALVEAGGDIVVSDPPPDEAGWKIQVANAQGEEKGKRKKEKAALQSTIHNPQSAIPSTLNPQPSTRNVPVLLFANAAVSTSGDTEQFVEIGGKRYSHIVDPRTGQALTSRVQVTIVARNGLTSDSLSKVASLLEPDASAAVMKMYPGTTAYIRKISIEGQ